MINSIGIASMLLTAHDKIAADIAANSGHSTESEDIAYEVGAWKAYHMVVMTLARDLPDIERQVFLSIARVAE